MADERVGIDLGPKGEDNWISLKSALESGSGFELFFIISDNRFARDEVRRRVREAAMPPIIERIYDPPAELAAIAGDLVQVAEGLAKRHALWVEGRGPAPVIEAAWRTGLARLNERRNVVIRECPHAVLMAGDHEFYEIVSRHTPDFFSVRSRADFFPDPPTLLRPAPSIPSIGYAPLFHELQPPEYYHELAAGLEKSDRAHEKDLRARMLFQAAISHEKQGELSEALRALREDVLPTFERLGDVRSQAATWGRIADVLFERGDLDGALRALQDQVLPTFRRLGDVRECAAIWGKIADVLFARGELDEALRIRLEEQLPVYERLGDVRARAMTAGKIADVLFARGEFDEALRVRREEELPVYEMLGDARARARTWGKIADVLFARGELDEALRIRREKELVAYQRLGDVRERAATWGKVADVLFTRGDLNEALLTLRTEVLPTFQQLTDARSCAVTWGKIADVLFARGDLDAALHALQQEALPVFERLNDARSCAVIWGRIADVLLARERGR